MRTLYSLISTGTEMMKVEESKLSLVGMARARPDQVKKVLETVQQQGALTTYKKAMNRLDSYSPLGYSLAGIVLEVGKGAEEFAVGQLVACAGNEFALHAEINWVPTNLCVAVPDGVSPQLAAFATVGSIALQGVRQGNVQIGDTACVIGLGLVGQLVVQLLVASGVQVVGLDPDPQRCRLAEKAGALLCTAPDDDGSKAVEQALFKASGGLGADRIFLVAGGSSNQPVELAARLARDRATVVDIGKCKLDLPWNDYYEKELELRFSRSYGPGRYDPKYELEGVDYPAGYVRWTERRNLHCFVNAVARKEVDPEPLIGGIFPFRKPPVSTNDSALALCKVSASSSSTRSRTRSMADSRRRPTGTRRRHLPIGRPRSGTVAPPAHCGLALSAPETTPHRCCFRTSPINLASNSPAWLLAARCQRSTRSASSVLKMRVPISRQFSKTRHSMLCSLSLDTVRMLR